MHTQVVPSQTLSKDMLDHKPSEAILKKPLTSAPRRLQGMMMRLQKYDIEVRHVSGKEMHIADLLPRAYLPLTNHPSSSGLELEIVNAAVFLPISEVRLQEIRNETQEDEQLQVLKSVILQGWPQERKDVPLQATPYFSMRDEMSVQDGLIYRGERESCDSQHPAKKHERDDSCNTSWC